MLLFQPLYLFIRRYSVKRDLLQCQTRPIVVSKETYYSVKRDLLQHLFICRCSVKRDLLVSKQTYYCVKRDLLQYLFIRR